jgi:hypothetical protein
VTVHRGCGCLLGGGQLSLHGRGSDFVLKRDRISSVKKMVLFWK